MKKDIACILIFIFCSLTELAGQEIGKKLTLYSVEHGLCQSSVHSITQDNYGYIWISTGNGLNCFDGKDFTCYFPPAQPLSTYSINRIRKVISNDIGNLWIGTDEGLFYFNRATGQMEDPFPAIIKLKKGYCYPLFQCEDTLYALFAGSSVASINLHDHGYEVIPLNTSFYVVYSPGSKNHELVGVSIQSGLWFLGINSGTLNIQQFEVENIFFSSVSDIKYYKEGKYIVLFAHEIFLFDKDNGKIEPLTGHGIPLEKGKGIFKSLAVLNTGEVWIGTSRQGIFVLDSALHYRGQITEASGRFIIPDQLKNITALYEDRDGNIWTGTDGNGLGLIQYTNAGFWLLNHESRTQGKLSSDFIWSFYEDEDEDEDGTLWIGTSNEGINKWDRKTNTIESFLLSQKRTFPTPNDVYTICPVNGQKLLIGTSCGIWLFDKISHRSSPISDIFNEQHIRRTSSIIPIENNRFIARIQNQCFFIKLKEETFVFDTIQIPDTVSVNYICLSETGKIYAYSNNGIYEIRQNEVKFSPFVYKSGQMTVKINSHVERSDGLVWAATDKGLAVMDFNGQIYTIYTTSDGLPNQYLYGILADSKENLWISSNRGLSHFNPAFGKFNSFSVKDGLQSYEFNAGATFKNKRGEMFFGGINGFNYFLPDSLYYSEGIPAVVISGILVNDLFYHTDTSIMAKKLLSLEYNQNTITFEFNAIEFSNPDHSAYTCFLDGYDKDWVSLGTVSLIRYSKLPPGKYNFMVKAANRQGDWSDIPASITLIVARPYWMKPWFIILMAGWAISIIAIVVYYLSTIRIRKKLENLEHQREISLIRRRISSDLHDDIGTGLSKLAMMNDTILMDPSQNPEIKERLKKVSSGARSLIDHLRVIVWTLNPQFDQLESLVSYIHQQAGDFLDNSSIKATFDLPSKIPQVTVTPELKRNVHFTVMESLHNVIRHSGSTEVSVKVEIEAGHLVITVSDTGKGFDPERITGFGNGLHIMKKRIEDINGELSLESKEGTGTTVKIKVGF